MHKKSLCFEIKSTKIRVETNSFLRNMVKKGTDRLLVGPLGEFYNDLLEVDAWIRGNSKVSQAASLLCSKLQEREEKINSRLEYLAKKRGIDKDEMRALILRGEVERMLPEDTPLPSELMDDLDESED